MYYEIALWTEKNLFFLLKIHSPQVCPNPSRMRFNFFIPDCYVQGTSKCIRIGDGDGEGKTRPDSPIDMSRGGKNTHAHGYPRVNSITGTEWIAKQISIGIINGYLNTHYYMDTNTNLIVPIPDNKLIKLLKYRHDFSPLLPQLQFSFCYFLGLCFFYIFQLCKTVCSFVIVLRLIGS